MRQFALFFVVFILFFGFAPKTSLTNAQVLYFCENVKETGYPEKESSTFAISPEGGWLKFLVRLDDEVDCKEVKYVIYKVSENRTEIYDTTIYQNVEKDRVWFWKKITFYNDGKYNVYVYDQYDNFLTSAALKIKYQ